MTKTKALKNNAIRHTEYYNMTDKLDELYQKSIRKENFIKLMKFIESPNNIMMAYRNIKQNHGSMTKGTDAQTIKNLEVLTDEEFIKKVQNKLKCYKPKAVKRVEIPKPNGDTRPLGIPTIMDRIIQQCILQILEPICEAKFYEHSYGFRPNRSAEHAIAHCAKLVNNQKLYYVVDVDIKGFFDNVNHNKLMRQLWSLGIRDKKLLSIIKEMLKAPIVMPNGKTIYPNVGTPQGGILSPLLANVVLNELDWWITGQWEDFPSKFQYSQRISKTGNVCKYTTYQQLRKNSKLKEMFIVRYADDFKIFCKTKTDAQKAFKAVTMWLKERLGLDVNIDKSKVINLKKQNSEFLGFEMKAFEKKKSHVLRTHISRKARKRITNQLIEQIKLIQHPKDKTEEWKFVQRYNSMVLGVHNYYKIATCVADDCNIMRVRINKVLCNRLIHGNRKHRIKSGNVPTRGYIAERYGKSKQLRFINGKPLIPIGFIKTKDAMNKKASINKYTSEGRKEIHKNLDLDSNILKSLMNVSGIRRSIEFMDNRISLYSAQKGKCAITGKVLEIDEIDCHHKIPESLGGKDDYENLIIIQPVVHRLIHASKKETIEKYLKIIAPTTKMLTKINILRKLCNNSVIEIEVA